MIDLIVARNPYDSSDRTVEKVAWIEFGVAGDYAPSELDKQCLAFYVDGVRCEIASGVPEGSSVGIVVLPGVETVVGKALINVLVAAAVSYTFSLLFGRPARPVDGDDSSPSYAWTGIRQNDRQGSPINVPAGKMRIGGTVIGEDGDAQATPPKNVLFQLVALGEGPFESVAGVTSDTANGTPINSQDELGEIIRANRYAINTNFKEFLYKEDVGWDFHHHP